MNFFQRLHGIFFNPQPTLKALAENPVWVNAIILLLILIAIYTFIIIPYQRKDSIQFMKNDIKIQEKMDEENFKRTLDRLENPPKWARYTQSFIITPFSLAVGFLFSSLIILVLGRFSSTEGTYLHVFSAFIWVQFIDKLLGNAVRLILILIRNSVMNTSTSLALFFPHLEVTSSAYIILSQFDFFQLWLFGILGYGLSFIFKIELKKALITSYAFWLLKSIVNIAISSIFLGFIR